MNDVLGIAGAFVALLLGVFTLLGLAVRYVLMPYLKTHLIDPVQETRKQVTENHHSNAQPTVLDRIDDVHEEVKAMARMFDGHLDWSQREVDRIWRTLEAARRARRAAGGEQDG